MTATAKKIVEPNLTPMMKQYLEIKADHQDAILFFRLGDFYEMFFEDAETASQILELTLTYRNKNADNPVPLCGIPHHAAESYIGRLVKAGKKVVICDQVEDAAEAKGIVKREVTRVVSPGIVFEDQSLSARTNNFLMAAVPLKDSVSVACVDVSTGLLEYFTLENWQALAGEVASLGVRELLMPEAFQKSEEGQQVAALFQDVYHHAVSDLYGDADFSSDLLLDFYQLSELSALGLSKTSTHLSCLGLLFGYLKENKSLIPKLLNQPVLREQSDYMVFDEPTLRNLELFKTSHDGVHHGTLLWHLDHCLTPMGSRRLAEYIRAPLKTVDLIQERLNAVSELKSKSSILKALQEALQQVSDLERLANRFVVGSGNARDALSLAQSLLQIPQVTQALAQSEETLLLRLKKQLKDFSKLAQHINDHLVEEPPLSLKDGGVIAAGVNTELDELRSIEKNGKSAIAQMEAKEKSETGITSLKIRFNNVFGYYIEVTNTHKDKVPDHYVRKQTLTNAERYITDELKKFESKVLGASERIKALEYQIFCELRTAIQEEAAQIKTVAAAISHLDVLQSFANVANRFDYCQPVVTNDVRLDLKEARHPVLDRLNDDFIPNDVLLDGAQNSFLMITGPNMAGKSTVMRTVALVTVMSQIGSFVPCASAHVGICDRVFTRVGAHDHLQKGMSTFMVEMVETARILREASARSLILLDEIGRGTSTFDGLSIAWAVTEDIHDRLAARTLFATHYHELCDLADQKRGIVNAHMAIKEYKGQVIFLRKLREGGTNRSYGVQVAGMAGLPENVVKRAKEILKLLEIKDLSFQSDLEKQNQNQMALFEQAQSEVNHPVLQKLKDLDLNNMTPIEVLNTVSKWQSLLESNPQS